MPVSTKLDRLSALLQGLAPRVEVVRPAEDCQVLTIEPSAQRLLHLHLATTGALQLGLAGEEARRIEAPAIIVCRADTRHSLTALPGASLQSVVCAKAHLEGPVAPLLLGEFAQPLVVSLVETDCALNRVIGLICAEVAEPRCGQPALLERAGDILFIGLLRHLVAHPRTRSGLLSGLSDPRIASALVAMHRAPQNDWSLETLASTAGMSRTAFATRFRDTMNSPPGKYLGNLRLSIAQRAIDSGHGLKHAARECGYRNVSALSRALSRARVNNRGSTPSTVHTTKESV